MSFKTKSRRTGKNCAVPPKGDAFTENQSVFVLDLVEDIIHYLVNLFPRYLVLLVT